MRKFILFVIVIVVAAWGLQNYTSFKAIDYAKNYWEKIDWQALEQKATGLFRQESQPSANKVLNIFIRDGKFVPNMNAMEIGTKVIWINEDTKPHIVSGENWGSQELFPGESFSKNFDVAGEYIYSDSVNSEMTGKLIVQ
jgi:plastocyanin